MSEQSNALVPTFETCSLPSNNHVIVELVRDDHGASFGFNIKGGIETGCPVYIWRVEPGSLADRSGLKSGDEIVQANGVPFNGITHADALKVLKCTTHVTLYVKAPNIGPDACTPPNLHTLNPSTNSHRNLEFYSWVDRHGNPVPPPDPINPSTTRLINLDISPGQNLGLMIRGGSEYGLGIYVTGVDPGSVAERVGLTRGDEIISVNGKNFTTITHDKAVHILKSNKRMSIVAAYLGKIPADLHDGEDLWKLHEQEAQINNNGSLDLDFVSETPGRCTTSILQMIEEKARTVLNKSEHSRFTFYKLEYMQGFLPIVTFVRILLELLNTHEKYTLLTEVRELIRPSDLPSFDELIYVKSSSFRVSSSSNPPIPGPLGIFETCPQQSVSPPPPPPPPPPPQSIDPSSLDILNPSIIPLPSSPVQQSIQVPPVQQQQQQQQNNPQPQVNRENPPPPPQPPPFERQYTQQPDEIIDEDFIEHPTCNEYYAQDNGNGGPQLLITHDPAAAATSTQVQSRNPMSVLTPNKLATAPTTPGGTLQQPVSNQLLPPLVNGNNPQGPHPVAPQSSSVPAVRFKVRISKIKQILGIAIEGGSNTPHRLPRIIDVNPDGSAFHSNLRAGQVLLTVDGKKLDGLTHEEIARLILDCYVDHSKSTVEFLVVEAKQNYYYFTQNQTI